MKSIRASDKDITRLEQAISENPELGDIVPGLGGIRNVRFGLGNKGKRGGGRAIYFLVVSKEMAVMVFAYAKSDQVDITLDEKKLAMALMAEVTNEKQA